MFNINKKTSSTKSSWISTSFSESEMMTGKQRRLTADIFAGSRKILFAVALFVLLAGVNCAADQKTVKPSPVSPLSSSSASIAATPKDEIYIDDESIEGSGGRSGLHDDLEKDPDYSGSGFGPDDEDSSTDLQQSHRGSNSQTHSGKHNTNNNNNNNDDNDDLITSRTHHQTNSGTIIGTNSGSNSGIIGGNSGSNTGLNTIATTSTKYPTSSSTSTNQNTSNKTSINTSTSSAAASKNRDSSLYPTNTKNNQFQQTHLPATPHYPAGGKAHTDDEDFDLGEGGDSDHDKKQQFGGGAVDNDDGLFVGSGDGGFIDHTDDDDDHTGDVDDDDEDLIRRPTQSQPKLDSKPTSSVDNSSSSTSSSTTSSTTDRKQILSFDGDEDKHEEDDNDDNDDGDDDDEDDDDYDDEDDKSSDKNDDNDLDGHDETNEEDDNTEVYIDGTESNAKGDSSSSSQDNERGNANQGNTIHELDTNNVNSQPTDTKVFEHTTGNDVLIMDTSGDDRTASFFAQPGILAAVIGGAVVGLLCAILVVMFIVYRMRKKDEGSYALDEPKRSPAVNSYAKNANNREFFA